MAVISMVGDEQISSLQTAFSIPVGASLRPAGAAASVSGRGWGCGGWGVCGITQWHVLPCRQLDLSTRADGRRENRTLPPLSAEKCVLNFASQWYNYYYYPTCAGNYYKNAVLFFFLLKLCHLFFFYGSRLMIFCQREWKINSLLRQLSFSA